MRGTGGGWRVEELADCFSFEGVMWGGVHCGSEVFCAVVCDKGVEEFLGVYL